MHIFLFLGIIYVVLSSAAFVHAAYSCKIFNWRMKHQNVIYLFILNYLLKLERKTSTTVFTWYHQKNILCFYGNKNNDMLSLKLQI